MLRRITFLARLVDPDGCESIDRFRGAVMSDHAEVTIPGLEIYDRTPFEEIEIQGMFDLIVSVSVLEHVMRPHAVVEKMFSLLAPGGHAWHSVDFRDHRDFGAPLAFLEMAADEYAAIATENRLRISDWSAIFEAAGFELVHRSVTTLPAGCNRPTNADYLYRAEVPEDTWVDDTTRARFAHPFNERSLDDLSTLGAVLLYRKPLRDG
jgi:SAM-dependent methyltransferase